MALVAVIRFQRRLKTHMEGKQVVSKLFTYKLFMAITTIQNVRLG